ncbi:hypothetical protein BGX38DRAFT_1178623 [Terfezia claveryi]|nr:hypothetical protein BGX38DRAFT_1178623 [Terfezia claveryi]
MSDINPASPAVSAGIKHKGKAPCGNHDNVTPGPSSFRDGLKFAKIAPKLGMMHPKPTIIPESPYLMVREAQRKRVRVQEDPQHSSHLVQPMVAPLPAEDSRQRHNRPHVHNNIPESNGLVGGMNIPMEDVEIMQRSAFQAPATPLHPPPEADAKLQTQTPLSFHLPFTLYSPPMVPENPQILNPQAPEGGFCPTCHAMWNNLRECIMAFTFSQGLPHGTNVSGELLKSYFGLDYHWRQGHVVGLNHSEPETGTGGVRFGKRCDFDVMQPHNFPGSFQ